MESSSAHKRIGVIGAGIIGTSCAYRLQTELLNASVTIVAADFSPNLTSDGAPGIHEVYNCYGTDPEKIREWSLDCYRHLRRVALSSDSLQAGVSILRIILLAAGKISKLPLFYEDLEHFRRLTLEEVREFNPGAKDGCSYTSATCEPRIYLPWLYKRFVSAGGQMVKAKVTDLPKFCDEYDLVVNCTGLGAVELVNDMAMIPIKGQLLRIKGVNAVNCTLSILSDVASKEGKTESTYIIPGRDFVTLGGTYEMGEGSTNVDSKESQRILASCAKRLPAIKDAEVVWEWAGLRPYRKDGIRLEIDESYHRTTKVIHNYGHAGIGITLHWGCAREVLNLARQCFKDLAALS